MRGLRRVGTNWVRIGEAFTKNEPEKGAYILDSYDHLLDRYDEAHGPGHEAGLAVIGLEDSSFRRRLSSGKPD